MQLPRTKRFQNSRVTNDISSCAPSDTRPEFVLFTGHSADVVSLTFSPDGLILASAGYDRSIVLWDIPSGTMLRRIAGLGEAPNWIHFTSDGTAIASSDWDGVRLWDPRDGTLISAHQTLSCAFAFTPEGHILARTRHGDGLVIWDVRRRKIIRRLKHGLRYAYEATLSADGSMLAITDLGSVQILNVPTGQVMHTLTVSKEQLQNEGLGALDIEDVVFSSDGNTIAAVCFFAVRFWDTRSGNYLGIERYGHCYAHSVAFSPDGRIVATGWGRGSILLRNTKCTKQITAHKWWARCLAFSPDGSLLASGGSDSAVRLWDSETGEATTTLSGQCHEVSSVAFTPDGKGLVSGHADGIVAVWDAKGAALKRTICGLMPPVSAVAVSPDGRTIASGGGRVWRAEKKPAELKLLNLENPNDRVDLSTGPAWYDSLAYSSDGRLLASEGETGVINLWNVSTGQIEMTMPGCYRTH